MGNKGTRSSSSLRSWVHAEQWSVLAAAPTPHNALTPARPLGCADAQGQVDLPKNETGRPFGTLRWALTRPPPCRESESPLYELPQASGCHLRYFLLADYLVPALTKHGDEYGTMGRGLGRGYYTKLGYDCPRNYTLAQLAGGAYVRVVFFDTDRGVLLLRASSLKAGYQLAAAIQGFMALFWGHPPDRRSDSFFLHPVRRVPQPDWSEAELRTALELADPEFGRGDWVRLNTGVVLLPDQLRRFPPILPILAGEGRLREALLHAEQSRSIFNGFMVGSYYHLHYASDRRNRSTTEMMRRYFEDRAQHELAFLSAFKSIEAIFGGSQLNTRNLGRKFRGMRRHGVTPGCQYKRYHEIFQGRDRVISYYDLILHFLRIRNAVAAHANSTPPRHLAVTEDTLFEIQHFVACLIDDWAAAALGGEVVLPDLPVVFCANTTRGLEFA